MMKRVILCVFLVIGCARANWLWGNSDTPECEFTPAQVQQCIAQYVDTDGNNVISETELDAARDAYTSSGLKLISWIASYFTDALTNESIMHNCDTNGDGILSPDDFIAALFTQCPMLPCIFGAWHCTF